MRPPGNAQGEGVQNPSGEPVARPRPQYFACVVKIAETGVFWRPCVVPVGVGRVDVLGAGVCAYRRGGVYVCTRDDYPLFLQATNREISGGFIPPQGMGIFRTETALFWTFAENMRDYTPNGLRVQNTGFFQKIITPGNRAFSRVRTVGRFNPAPVPERFPPQLFQRYRLQTEPPPFWLIYPGLLGARIFPQVRTFQK